MLKWEFIFILVSLCFDIQNRIVAFCGFIDEYWNIVTTFVGKSYRYDTRTQIQKLFIIPG